MLDDVKTYIGIPLAVTVYDTKLEMLIKQALARLTKLSLDLTEPSDLVTEYVCTYCRLHNISEPSIQWAKMEEARLQELIETMYYGGV